MTSPNINSWLQQWVDENIQVSQFAESKAELNSDARQCADDALAAGFTIAELKDAAGGDLETYLMDAQNSFTGEEVERLASKSD